MGAFSITLGIIGSEHLNSGDAETGRTLGVCIAQELGEKGLEDGVFSRIVKRDPDENEEVQSRVRPPSGLR